MAKKSSKKEVLTLEEKVEKALVPVEEQPYAVPENWVWTRLGSCVTQITKSTDIFSSKLNYIGLDNMKTDSGIVSFGDATDLKSSKTLFETNDILYGKLRAYLNKHDVALVEGICSTDILVLRSKIKNEKYINFFFDTSGVAEYVTNNAKGINLPRVTGKIFLELPFPLPPLPEQTRIVSRIESLFSKLDEARERIESSLNRFEERKSAILHKAFSGELTKKWREENGVEFDFSIIEPLAKNCDSFKYGTSSKSSPSGTIIVLRMGNLQGGEIDYNDLVFSNNEDDNEKYILRKGDVLFNRTNSPIHVGKTSVYRGEYPSIYAGYLIKIEYSEKLNGYFLNYMMNTPEAKKFCNRVKTDGVNQSNINAKKLSTFEIPVPSLPEQEEIVRLLDNILGKETQAKEFLSLLEKIDLMKKAILGRAFRGELGTNDPLEESAQGLLREVFREG